MLGTAVATGLVALLGVAWRFEEPLYPGTRVHVDLSVGSVRPTRRPDRGVVVLDAALSDDAGTIYQRGEFTMLVRTRPAGIA